MRDRLTVTEVAKELGITARTIMRWEKSGKIKRSKRDWRGWRFYHKEDLEDIRKFYESSYEEGDFEKATVPSLSSILLLIGMGALLYSSIISGTVYASPTKDAPGVKESEKSVDIVLNELPAVNTPASPATESTKYTLGPDDVIEIEVLRHPEFSGEYKVNSEGKIEYKYIGDVIVDGLNKDQVKERLEKLLGEFLIKPEIDVQIVAYLSKVFYVVGDVVKPGKFYMKGDTVTVLDAIIEAGLPTHAAATRRCRLITPGDGCQTDYKDVNVYELLYEGNMEHNLVMEPGDVLYVPATVMAKIIRVISPVTSLIGDASGTASKAAAAAAL